MRTRNARECVTRFAHRGANVGNYANHVFHLRQAGQLATGVMAHIAGAEKNRPGCTGNAIEHLTALMSELQRSGVTSTVSMGLETKDEEE